MRNKFIFACVLLLGLLLMGCPFSLSPYLVSIEFTDDDVIEYRFPFVIGDNASGNYGARLVSIIPDDEYRIKYQTFSISTGTIYFNKDIPDGTTIELEFYNYVDDYFDGEYLFSHTFVKGEKSEDL